MNAKQVKQLARFASTSLFSNGIGLLCYLLLTTFGLIPELSASGVYLVAASISYIGNYMWTFEAKSSHKKTVPRFIGAHLIGFSVQVIVISLLYRTLRVPALAAQITALFCVAVCLFLLFRYYVYVDQ